MYKIVSFGLDGFKKCKSLQIQSSLMDLAMIYSHCVNVNIQIMSRTVKSASLVTNLIIQISY